jgi:uncharacterized protein DUF3435
MIPDGLLVTLVLGILAAIIYLRPVYRPQPATHIRPTRPATRVSRSGSMRPEKAADKGPIPMAIKVTLKTPKFTSNVIFSVPHRLLVIALRRKLIVGVESISDLMTYDRRNIVFKPACLDQPVLYGSGPKGAGLADEPMSALALTEYLQQRGAAVEFAKPITFYSLRRRSPRNLSTLVDMDTARAVMNHAPDSRILQMYYVDPTKHLDLTSILLGKRGPTQLTGLSDRTPYL